MDNLRQLANELEWSNYARTAYFATVVPGLEVRISHEVILITDPAVPMTDGNHAAMLRATPDRADALIERIIQHYRDIGQKPYVVVSPGCTPDDLSERLQMHGFSQYGDIEYWLTLKNPWYAEVLRAPGNVLVRQIGNDQVPVFCRVMSEAYQMPEDTLPVLEHAFGYINDLPGIHNYVAYLEGKPVGCISLFTYLGYSALGSGGVLPGARNAGVAFALVAHAYQDWKKEGSNVLVLQTVLPKLERMLRIGGCQRVFTRTHYILQ